MTGSVSGARDGFTPGDAARDGGVASIERGANNLTEDEVERIAEDAVPEVMTIGHGDDRERWRGFDEFFTDDGDSPFGVERGPDGYAVELEYLANQRSRALRYNSEERSESAICTINTWFLKTFYETDNDIAAITIIVWLLSQVDMDGKEHYDVANVTRMTAETAAAISNWENVYDVSVQDPWESLPELADEYEWTFYEEPG